MQTLVIRVLSATVLLVVNPLEMTHRARDAARLQDLVTLQESINKAVQASPSNNVLCDGKLGSCMGDSTDKGYNIKATDGTGWVKVKLLGLQSLPIDPVNDSNYSYTYCSDGRDWEIQARVESKQVLGKAKNDGGDEDDQYEVGSNLTLCK